MCTRVTAEYGFYIYIREVHFGFYVSIVIINEILWKYNGNITETVDWKLSVNVKYA